MKAKTIKLSICQCGFPALHEDIPLGTEYEIDLECRSPGTFICGGCKAVIKTIVIFAEPRTPEGRGGPLPLGIFFPTPTCVEEPPAKPAVKPNCHECQYRNDVPGDSHIRCSHPKIGDPYLALIHWVLQTPAGAAHNALNITADQHGMTRGWFVWPVNFDPTWLLTCNGFTKKQPPE